MNEIKIRDIPADVVLRLDELARKKHMSRNEYLKRLLCSEAQFSELKDMDELYSKLVDYSLEEIKAGRQLIEQNTKVMQEVLKRL